MENEQLEFDILTFVITVAAVFAVRKSLAASEQTTGILQTVVACGMMVSSIIIGSEVLKRNYVNVMVASFIMSGISMVGFGATTSVPVIIISGFLFFASLPFTTICIDK